MKKGKGLGTLLLLVAIVLYVPLGAIGLVVSVISLTIRAKFLGMLQYLDRLFYAMAVSIDQLGNVTCQHLFNLTLIKNDDRAHKFGDPDETISYVLGFNKRIGALSRFGYVIAAILNLIDADHVEKALREEDEKLEFFIKMIEAEALEREQAKRMITKMYKEKKIKKSTKELALEFLTPIKINDILPPDIPID
jgi:hypothetical protein